MHGETMKCYSLFGMDFLTTPLLTYYLSFPFFRRDNRDAQVFGSDTKH
jgi:hypothetical protein